MSLRTLAHRSFLTASLATLTLVLGAPPASAGEHVDARIGYKIDVPKGWTSVPIDADEGWIVGKWFHKKKHYHTDPTSGGTYSIQPRIQVVAFVEELINKADSDIEVEGDQVDLKLRLRLYQDYLEFMRETYQRGFFVAEEGTENRGGIEVETLLLQTQGSGPPIHIKTWIYSLEVGKVAIHVEMLESGWKKLGKDADKIFSSFEAVERTEALDANPITGGFVSIISLTGMTPKEREIRLKEMARQEWDKISSTLPDDWLADEYDGIPVVTHADKRHAKKLVDNVVAVRKWLDKTFPDIAEGNYARPPILRICASREEESAFRSGTAINLGRSTEIVTHKDQSGATGYEWDYVNQQTLRLWFLDKDRDTYEGLPAWFSLGLEQLVGNARPKGSKLEFKESDWERTLSRGAAREDGVIALKGLMMMTRRDFLDHDGWEVGKNVGQAMTALRFFIDGPGSKKKLTKNVITDYLRNLRDVLSEIEQREDASEEDEEEDEPETEEEEEEYARKRREKREALQQEILEETFHRTFGSWSDKDWESVEKMYQKSY